MPFRQALLATLGLGLALLPASAAHGENGTVQARISEGFDYNSNPLMSTEQATPAYGSVTRGELSYKATSPTGALNANGAVVQNVFNRSAFTTTDVHGDADASRQIQRWGARMRGTVDYDTTRTSELTSYGINVGNVRHLGFSAAPELSFHPTPMNSIFVGASALSSTYDSSAYSDYYMITAGPGYSHNFNPRNAANVTVQFERYQELNDPNLTVDTISPTIGWTSLLSSKLQAYASVGGQVSQQRSMTQHDQPWVWEYVFRGGLTFTGEVDKIDVRASREPFPFGNGTQALLTGIALTELHNISQSLALGLTASYQDASYQGPTSGVGLSSLLTVGPNLTYRITDRLDLVTSYLYRRENLINSEKIVQDHAVILNLMYHPPAWRL